MLYKILLVFRLLLCSMAPYSKMPSYNISHAYCDADALYAEETNVSTLKHDEFYKICPGQYTHFNGSNVELGQPRCGDGSNYAFLVSRPPENKSTGRDKILIELSGGGACWDGITCAMQKSWLSVPQEMLGSVVGTSCTGWSMLGNTMLCGKTIGDTDFSEYVSISIPYCTQDVHMGDEPDTDYGVRHVGAHNLYRTLQWVFENFPDPSHIFITGCSAGATPFPVIYDLINSHYTANGKDDVKINGIADSPVFITPSYFLENGIQHWNLETIMDEIGFDFEKYKNDEGFPSAVLDFVLDKSKKTDRWGYVTHNADAVSLLYYSFMAGGTIFGGDGGLGRRLKSGDIMTPRRRLNDDVKSQWWTQMNNSMSLAMNDHDNFHSFVIEGSDHCTFGLNVPIQYGGFEEWASMIALGGDANINKTTQQENQSLLNNEMQPSDAANATIALSSNSTVESGVWGPPKAPQNFAEVSCGSTSFSLLALISLTLRFVL